MIKSVIYNSFDPFHIGHVSLIEKALKISDKVIIAIKPEKKSIFDIHDIERLINGYFKYNERILTLICFGDFKLFCIHNGIKLICGSFQEMCDYDFKKLPEDIDYVLFHNKHNYLSTEFIKGKIQDGKINEIKNFLICSNDVYKAF